MTGFGRHGWSGRNSPARRLGADASDNAATRHFAGTDLHPVPVAQNNHNNNNSTPNATATAFRHPSSLSGNGFVAHASQAPAAGRALVSPPLAQRPPQNQNAPKPAASATRPADLIIIMHPAQAAAQAANNYNNSVASPVPARSQPRYPLAAGAAENRQVYQPNRPFNPPVAVERPQPVQPPGTVAPAPVVSGQTVSADRPQMAQNQPQQNFSRGQNQNQSAPRNNAQSSPAPAPKQAQPVGNGGFVRGQGLYTQNH
jgi:hypothetical protein